jgi:predicted DNA-binding protein (MmcQ/YjbR family)
VTAAADPLERVRQICLALPGAWEKLSHGEPTFWVGKRMFAMLANAGNHHGAGRHAVWCKATFVTQDFLIRESPDRYFKPPYAGASGWVGMWIDRRPRWTEVADRVRHAYDLAGTPKAKRSPRRSRR